ncbi:MAG: glycosyltransferase family 4 protein [Candidatus Pacebacteria bacterium]|nr:glycosyltransferase family 4 protein [Candidatus Paceibacterota bacterium]
MVFLSRLYSPHIGGVEHHIRQLSRELHKRNYDVTVVTEQYDGTLPLYEKLDHLHVVRIHQNSLHSKIGTWIWMLLHIKIFLHTERVHTHDVFWWYIPVRFVLFWKPVYTTFHGYEGVGPPSLKAVRSRKVSEFLSWGSICVGNWMRMWYYAKPTFVVYGAADAQPQKPVESQTAVFIGRLSDDTGVLEYVRVVLALEGQITLTIYGEGELLSPLQDMIRGVSYITYKGVTREPLKALARARFAFVSRYLGIIEAMQTGRYVCAHWNNEIKKDYLMSFPAIRYACTFSQPSQLVEVMRELLRNSTRENQDVHDAQIWALNQRWNAVADTYEDLWSRYQ